MTNENLILKRIKIGLRRAEINDSEDIWAWRNDFYTRLMSKKTDVIDWETHKIWFEKTLKNEEVFVYIGLDKTNQSIGMCKFEIDENQGEATVSINLNPEFRNKKLSYALLEQAINEFYKKNNLDLVAIIKKKNFPSIKCFMACGFLYDSSDTDFSYYKRAINNK